MCNRIKKEIENLNKRIVVKSSNNNNNNDKTKEFLVKLNTEYQVFNKYVDKLLNEKVEQGEYSKLNKANL
jgi:hypothetical protein